jgi:hypothetical protein
MSSTPARQPYRDRGTRLAIFGVLATLAGTAWVLLGLLSLAAPMLARLVPHAPAAVEARAAAVGMLLYVVIGGALIVSGIGSVRRRRWAPPVLLTLAWTWLIGGALVLLLTGVVIDDLLDGSGVTLPVEVRALAYALVFGLEIALGLLVPALFVWAYRGRDVRATCAAGDPRPAWTDRCPPPVLGLSLGLAGGGVLSLPLALYGVFPGFGVLLTGAASALAHLGVAAACLWLARSTYRLRPAGFWGATALVALLGLSVATTFAAVEPAAYLRAMGQAEESTALLAGLSRAAAAWGSVGLTAASLAYMASVHRHFRGSRSPPDA